DIPNDVCNHAVLNGIQIDNNFNPKVHDFVPFMKLDDEELFIWTHKKIRIPHLFPRFLKM
ncbi:hypothetical protein, partial [Shigella boydii]